MSVFPVSLSRAVMVGAIAFPGAAFADLSADDVWQHYQYVAGLYGGTLDGDISRQGDSLKITDTRFDATLPMDWGKISLGLGDMTLEEASDGSVSMSYPTSMRMKLTYTSAEDESYSGDITLTHEGLASKASGQPGDITFDYAASRIDMKIDLPNLPEGIESYSGSGVMNDIVGRTVHRTASGLVADSSFTAGKHEFSANQAMDLEDEGGPTQIQSLSGGERMIGTAKTIFPESGFDLLNLASALRAGLAFSGSFDVSGYYTDQTTTMDGAIAAQQKMTAATYATDLALDESGVLIEGPSKDLRIEIGMPAMGGMVFGADIASGYGKFRAPLLKEEGFAPAEIKLNLSGITLGDNIWAMGDPTGILPRDPADISLDLSGDIRHAVEWLDFANAEAAADALEGLPVEPQSLQLNGLRISAVGAEVTGDGAFTFDLTDLETFDGMPRPEGKLTLRSKGLNALLGKLKQLGIPEDQINGGMMMLGMFTAPDPEGGDDARKTVLEITPDGQVLNNGMRIR